MTGPIRRTEEATADAARPRTIACWRMTVNGISLPARERAMALMEAELEAGAAILLPPDTTSDALGARLHELQLAGTHAVLLADSADLIFAAFEQNLVDRVVCWIEPQLATVADGGVVGGVGVPTMDDAWLLRDVRYDTDRGAVRVNGRVSYS